MSLLRFAVLLALPTVVATRMPAAQQGAAMPSRSLKELEAAARRDSNDAEAQFDLALAYWKKHRWQQVDSLVRLAVQIDPWFAEGYLALYYLPFARRPSLVEEDLRGRVPEAWQQTVEDAHRFFQRAFRTDPLVNLRVLAVAFDFKEPTFEDVGSPEYKVYQRYYAWLVRLGEGRYADAFDGLTHVARDLFDEARHPDKVPDYILWYRGVAGAHARRYHWAVRDFQTLLDRARKHEQRDEIVHVPLRVSEYLFMLAALHHVAGGHERAMELYREALENDLGLVMAHTYLAGIHEAAGRLEDALVERRRAAEVGVDEAPAQLGLAQALFNVQRAAEAEEPARRALELSPRYAAPHYLLGRIAEELGRPIEAREHYTRFLAVAPRKLAGLTADATGRLAALPR
jgi:tetratricopeptide (TPR) repeat protein